jgi:hypothetical protein
MRKDRKEVAEQNSRVAGIYFKMMEVLFLNRVVAYPMEWEWCRRTLLSQEKPLMRILTLVWIVTMTIFVGCTETPRGSPVDNDQKVLTGGPITGTTIRDLPRAVKNTVKKQMPNAEISNIGKITQQDGRVVYELSFVDPDGDPEMWVRDDGQILPKPIEVQQ